MDGEVETMKRVFGIWALTLSFLFIFCNLSFALPYYSPPDGSSLGTTVLINGTGRTVGVSAWSWLQKVSTQTYTYFAYRIFNTSPYSFSPYISIFGVANLSGLTADVTGCATSSAGVTAWLGISLPSNTDWLATSDKDLIFPGQFSNAGTLAQADDYFENAILGSHSVGLVSAYASGGGYIVSGETYSAIPEPACISLLSGLVAILFGILNLKKI